MALTNKVIYRDALGLWHKNPEALRILEADGNAIDIIRKFGEDTGIRLRYDNYVLTHDEICDCKLVRDEQYRIPVYLKLRPGCRAARLNGCHFYWVKAENMARILSILTISPHRPLFRSFTVKPNTAIIINNDYIYFADVVDMNKEEEEKMPPRINIDTTCFWGLAHTVSAKPVSLARKVPEIERVIFNYPATIVIWKDDTKTVVKCSEKDQYDEETGLALCIAKKALGNKGNWYNEFKKWLPKSSNLDSNAILAEIAKAARETKFKKFDRDRINKIIKMMESASNCPISFPVILTRDDAETVKDVLKQVMASIS